jgi:hypothetical protein
MSPVLLFVAASIVIAVLSEITQWASSKYIVWAENELARPTEAMYSTYYKEIELSPAELEEWERLHSRKERNGNDSTIRETVRPSTDGFKKTQPEIIE